MANKEKKKIGFINRGRVGFIDSDGSGLQMLDLEIPDQVSWHLSPVSIGGGKVLLINLADTLLITPQAPKSPTTLCLLPVSPYALL